jgi:hypothetical protein
MRLPLQEGPERPRSNALGWRRVARQLGVENSADFASISLKKNE